jgi:hypothetical protein
MLAIKIELGKTFCANLPAAAAGSTTSFFGESVIGLPKGLPSGLLLRLVSGCLAGGGDLERRSNREERFGSGSVWSKRERFAVLLSVSSIFASYNPPKIAVGH